MNPLPPGKRLRRPFSKDMVFMPSIMEILDGMRARRKKSFAEEIRDEHKYICMRTAKPGPTPEGHCF